MSYWQVQLARLLGQDFIKSAKELIKYPSLQYSIEYSMTQYDKEIAAISDKFQKQRAIENMQFSRMQYGELLKFKKMIEEGKEDQIDMKKYLYKYIAS